MSITYKSPRSTWSLRGGGVTVAVPIFIAILYAVILVSLPLQDFLDHQNYLNYASNASEIFSRRLDVNIISLLVNEPIWLFVNMILGALVGPVGVVRTIIFVSSFTVAYVTIRHVRSVALGILFLFALQVVGNNVVHIREGLAVAIFMFGWYTEKRLVKYLCLFACPFVHSGFFFVLPVWCYTWFVSRFRLSFSVRAFIFLLLGAGLAASAGLLASVVGARQAIFYESSALDVSGLGFVTWLAVLSLIVLDRKWMLKRYAFEVYGVMFYLLLYFVSPVSGRVFECVISLVLIACSYMTQWRKHVFTTLICLYVLSQYWIQYDLPWFGLGVRV